MRFSSSLPVALGALIALSAGCKDTTQPEPVSVNPPTSPPPAPTPPPSDRYIYLARADGSEITLLARGRSPSWSPDGSRVAYSSYRDGDAEIFVVNVDGTSERQITHNTGRSDSVPVWSPRGDQIAFLNAGPGGWAQLYVAKVDGTKPVALTGDTIRAGMPAWSPDGRSLAFARFNAGPMEDHASIAVIREDGSVVVARYFGGAYSPHAYRPSWSPDGRRIAFKMTPEYRPVIHVMNADGSEPKALTGGLYDVDPVWSPDGSRIAFARNSDSAAWAGELTIWVMNADGSGQTELTGTQGQGNPQWSPDGRHILFDSRWGTQIVPLSAGPPRTLFSQGYGARPSPDGTRIVFETSSPL